MYKNKTTGLTVCENVDDMIKLGITVLYEDEDYYYILTKKEDFYDNGMYKVNKATEEVSFIMYPVFITEVENKPGTKPVNIPRFIRERKARQ